MGAPLSQRHTDETDRTDEGSVVSSAVDAKSRRATLTQHTALRTNTHHNSELKLTRTPAGTLKHDCPQICLDFIIVMTTKGGQTPRLI